LFRLNDTNDVVPAFTPAAFVSVCSILPVEHPAACLLARASQRLWLFGDYGACYHPAWPLPPPWRWQWQRTPRGVLLIARLRFVVSTAFDPAVTSHTDVDRLLRTEPQVQLTPFVLNNHSNSFKSHGSLLPRFSRRASFAPHLSGAVPRMLRNSVETHWRAVSFSW